MSINWRKIVPLSEAELKKLSPKVVQTMKFRVVLIDPCELMVDETYQRKISAAGLRTIKKIIENWSWLEFKPPIVVWADGSFHVIDGQHTAIAAASHPDIDKIPVFIADETNIDIEDRAKAFVGHNTTRTQPSPLVVFKAQYEAGDETAVGVVMACRRAGVHLSYATALNAPPATAAVKPLSSIYKKHGLMHLADTLKLCVDADLHPIQGFMIEAVSNVLLDKKYDRQTILLALGSKTKLEFQALMAQSAKTTNERQNVLAYRTLVSLCQGYAS